jgi:peptidoglycan hydrolase-like protein with peptidoglycan-binding domain
MEKLALRLACWILAACLAGPALAQEDGYVNLVKRVQIALHLHGFDPGPVNGQNEGRTQAALAQFQLSENLPASGALDDATLKALDVPRDAATQPREEASASEEESASAGSSSPDAATAGSETLLRRP